MQDLRLSYVWGIMSDRQCYCPSPLPFRWDFHAPSVALRNPQQTVSLTVP